MTRPVRVKDDEWNDKTEDTDEDVSTSDNNYLSDKSSYDFKFKICLLGESGVGKSWF